MGFINIILKNMKNFLQALYNILTFAIFYALKTCNINLIVSHCLREDFQDNLVEIEFCLSSSNRHAGNLCNDSE